MYQHAGAGWSIRPFTAADAGPCLAIFRECLTQMPWRIRNRDQYMILRRSLTPLNAWVATEPDAGVIGFLTLQLAQDYIDHLFVDPDWRLCGVARGLLREELDGHVADAGLQSDRDAFESVCHGMSAFGVQRLLGALTTVALTIDCGGLTVRSLPSTSKPSY